MYTFDDSFLESIGLGGIPDNQKDNFLDYAQEQLEVRIGEKMSEEVDEMKLDEFERIIDNDAETVNEWVQKAGENYKENEIYKKLESSLGAESEELLGDFATALWLQENYPQYEQTIKDSIEGIRKDIVENKDAILASF